MAKIFLSHSTKDDDFVRALQQALSLHGQDVWIDSRELRGGDPLWSTIQHAIEAAEAYAVLISPEALQSQWIGKELKHALQHRQERPEYRIIPLSLNATSPGVLEMLFDEEPLYIEVSNTPGGIDAAVHPILVALGQRLPPELAVAPAPVAEPVEELVLELTNLEFRQRDKAPRASAQAELRYEPATPGQEAVVSEPWQLTAPVGPIELEEIRWYLEKFAIWPSEYFKPRADKVKAQLEAWGQRLYQAAFPVQQVAKVREAWVRIAPNRQRRFSIFIKSRRVANASEKRQSAAQEAATTLLALPWELAHDGKAYLFQGAQPTRVRRRLPREEHFDVPRYDPPIRILLITARPEDEACGYIDHRVSAEPLVAAMEHLGGLVELDVLNPPTLTAMRARLEQARNLGRPYHVVHFDGHGVYDKRVGLGGLCFEEPQDATGENTKLSQRRHQTIYSKELAPILRDHRIPLVFLEACQGAQADRANESVASELLKLGVASVIAMSHSVLVETARRFVEKFYQALAQGERVGQAMLAGQKYLWEDTFRGNIFGAGELRLHDWFVPVLFQEKADPQLFKARPAPQTQADNQAALQARLGELPEPPETGFIGRSREMLALERLLLGSAANYAVLLGQGGEGKTALAVESARWLLRSRQIQRVAFVSVEDNHHADAVLDALGRQLVGKQFSIASCDSTDQALQEIARALAEHASLIILDNMESLLPPPYLAQETPDVLSQEQHGQLTEILQHCRRLLGHHSNLPLNKTRLLFTSREALPAPFNAKRNQIGLQRLAQEEAIKLIERSLNQQQTQAQGTTSTPMDADRAAIEELVDAVQGHARTLALLAPSLQAHGVQHTHQALTRLLTEMEAEFPGNREQSVFASLALSLQRLSPQNQERVQALALFHGGVNVVVLHFMMDWEAAEVADLAKELIATGLANMNPYNHLALNPALSPYLRARLTPEQTQALQARWQEAMRAYVGFLVQQHSQDTQMAATLTGLELANLFSLLETQEKTADPAAIIALATSLYRLLQFLNKPRLLEKVGQARDAAAARLQQDSENRWSHAAFEAQCTRIEQQAAGGRLQQALSGAQDLLQRAQAAGETAYPDADYDLAMAYWLLARVLQTAGGAEQALPLLTQAQGRFEAIAETQNRSLEAKGASQRMAAVCLTERGECLRALGRLDAAAEAYQARIERDEQQGDTRDVAVGKGQLGTVRMQQGRHAEALAAYQDALADFQRLDEPGNVAGAWHQIGMVHQAAANPAAAEDAYRQALAINVRLGNAAGQASTLGQLGLLYNDVLKRPEEAVAFYRQAVDKYIEIGDTAGEGRQRNNLANTLRTLHRLDEARQEIRRAIECKAQYGHAVTPWNTWAILADIETDAKEPTAAAQAKARATELFLAYRRDGGENHSGAGQLAQAVSQALLPPNPDPAAAQALLDANAEAWTKAGYATYIQSLQAIATGQTQAQLADHPQLHYEMAAEIRLLIERLQKTQS